MESLSKKDKKFFENISLTAYRVIKLFVLLLESPMSEDEIKQVLKDEAEDKKLLSSDTVGIYINTLKSIGCKITRPSKSNNFKYILMDTPFKLNLNKDEVLSLIKVKKYIAGFDDWKLFQSTDEVISKIFTVLNDESQSRLKNVTKLLKRDNSAKVSTKLLRTLENYCFHNRTLHINYHSPESGEKILQITAEKISFENNAYYLWGINTRSKETQYIRIDRIKEIKAVDIRTSNIKPDIYTAVYKIRGAASKTFMPEDTEKIVETKDNEITVSAVVQNKFRFVQKMLSYGDECTVISPELLKNEVVQKLKSMAKVYQ